MHVQHFIIILFPYFQKNFFVFKEQNVTTNTALPVSHLQKKPRNISSNMTITTQTIAQGIPPRLHQPKPTKASGTKAAKTNKKDQKRAVVESDEDESSDKSELRVKKKQCTTGKQQHEVSVIEDDVEPAEKDIKDVDIGSDVGDELQPDEKEVSTDCLLQ